ncbi:MAG: SIMPL domain-containing protein [Patescibacteria group bacterium]
MNDKIKNYLGGALIVVSLVSAFAAWSFADTYSKSIEPSSFRSFSVSGEGKVTAVPDVAEFSFGVLTEGGKDIAALTNENTTKVNKAIAFVKSEGVADKDIKTENYSLTPRYLTYSCNHPETSGSVSCPPAEIVGYSINQTVSVKVRDFSKIGEALSGVVLNGANTVSSLNFTIDDSNALQNQARAEAISKAKEKAEVIATSGGFSIGRLLSIDEGYSPVPYYSAKETFGLGGAAPAPVIQPGSQEIQVTVNLRYEIK